MVGFSSGKFVILVGLDWGAAIVMGGGQEKANSQNQTSTNLEQFTFSVRETVKEMRKRPAMGPAALRGIGAARKKIQQGILARRCQIVPCKGCPGVGRR
jgi:hypothetical protein